MSDRFARLDRLPPYVFATVNQIKMQARREGKDIIDLGMGNPDLGTPSHIVEKLVEAARKPQNHRYSASMGITKLRLAIANWYKRRFDVEINPDTEAIVTIGIKEGLSHLVLVTTPTGRRGVHPEPHLPDPPVFRDHRGRGRARHPRRARARLLREPHRGRQADLAAAQDADPELPSQPHHGGRGP